MAVYYATKAYVLSFSEALVEEVRVQGVTVTALCPGPTRTGFQARAAMEQSRLVAGRTLMDAPAVAAGYRAMLAGNLLVDPGRANWAVSITPRFVPRRLLPGLIRCAQAET